MNIVVAFVQFSFDPVAIQIGADSVHHFRAIRAVFARLCQVKAIKETKRAKESTLQPKLKVGPLLHVVCEHVLALHVLRHLKQTFL